MRDRDRANKNEIEIFVFSVTSNYIPHDMLLLIFSLKSALPSAVGVSAVVVDETGYGHMKPTDPAHHPTPVRHLLKQHRL
jgi:hypothetical protein